MMRLYNHSDSAKHAVHLIIGMSPGSGTQVSTKPVTTRTSAEKRFRGFWRNLPIAETQTSPYNPLIIEKENLAGIGDSPQQADALAEELLAIGRDCASRLKKSYRFVDHGDLLYDDRGLPR